MLRFDPVSGNLAVTDLGRVASHYYIVVESIFTFNGILDKCGGAMLSDTDILDLIGQAEEFKQVHGMIAAPSDDRFKTTRQVYNPDSFGPLTNRA